MHKTSRARSIVSLVILAAAVVVFFNLQTIRDWVVLQRYTPPTEISQIADTVSLNDTGRKYFYVADPHLQSKDNFNSHCSFPERSLVLGCYDGQIYILSVNDQRLDGVEEVTAAHEMLHSAYQRLTSGEKAHLEDLLKQQLAQIKDQRILDTVEQYRSSDESSVYNEMHSIFGTEVRQLTPELENYYSRYFDNRSAVVKISEQYEAVFTQIENRIDEIDARLEDIKSQVGANKEAIKQKSQELNQRQQELDRLRQNGNIEEYNQKVPPYNQLVNQYNALVEQTQELINTYNSLVRERNDSALEQKDLIQTLDSTYQPR